MYKVVKYFTDLQDDNHAYNVGDTYPREGLSVTKKRINELKSNKNRQSIPLIVGTDDDVNIIAEKKVAEEKVESVEDKPDEKIEKVAKNSKKKDR